MVAGGRQISPDSGTSADPDLQAVIAAWPHLPEPVRVQVLRLIESAGFPALLAPELQERP